MKALHALHLLKRLGWARADLRMRDLRWFRREYHANETWDELIASFALGTYLLNEPLPVNGIWIPEVWLKDRKTGRWKHGIRVGGTMDMHTGKWVREPEEQGRRFP